MKYDDAARHYEGEFPAGAPPKFGGTHIALFLRWCMIKGWAGAVHLQQHPAETQGVIDGTYSATNFLFKFCGGCLSDTDLNADGNTFASQYYGKDGLYIYDYLQYFGDKMYVAPEADHNLNILGVFLEARLRNRIWTRTQYAQQKLG